MSDTREWIVEGFRDGIAALPDDLLSDLLPDRAREYGHRAARVAVAPVVWAQSVGQRLDTSQAMDVLGISRQALAKRVHAGSLLGLPGRGTTFFPAWQFDLEAGEIRPCVRQLLAAFTEEAGRVDPYVIAAWATTPQHEDLDGASPAEWMAKDSGEERRLIEAARRAAARLAA